MKTWVRNWLWYLNVIFLVSLAFWDQPESHWIMWAYLAAGPFLMGQAMWQRGIGKLLGLAHLIPWVPLLIALDMRLFTDILGPRIEYVGNQNFYIYLLVMIASLVICLAFDLYDVVRWLKGERFTLGSKEAVQSGASSLAPDLKVSP